MDFITFLLVVYLIYSTEKNAKIIIQNQKEIDKDIESLKNQIQSNKEIP